MTAIRPGSGRREDLLKRATGCLGGVATGDAIGKQTENLSGQDVLRWYPQGIRGFEHTPGSIIPRYVGNSKREWVVGETTDDTERTLAVARAVITDGRVSHVSVGREMLRCVKCIHPGLKSLWEFHQANDPGRIAATHDGCGAAIRMTPVGIAFGSERLDDLVEGSRQASISTHAGPLALAAAAATAAAVAAAIDGLDAHTMLGLAQEAARRAQRGGDHHVPDFASAVESVHDRLASAPGLTADVVRSRVVPRDVLTIVPLALALAARMTSAADAILLAANVGGDSDSVASIAGGILGARFPETVNTSWLAVVEDQNAHRLRDVATQLVDVRLRLERRPERCP